MLPRGMQGWFLFLEGGAVPLRQRGSGIINALREFQDRIVWRLPPANILIQQNEFAQLRMKRRRGWLYFCIRETIGRRIGVGIEECRGNLVVARPGTETAHFLRIGLAGDRVGQMGDAARMWRRGPAGKARYREIEAAPEKMDRAALAAETRTKFLENPISLQKHAPEPIGVFRIVSRVFLIAVKRDRLQRFVRLHPDLHFNAEFSQFTHHLVIESCHTLWLQYELALVALCGGDL